MAVSNNINDVARWLRSSADDAAESALFITEGKAADVLASMGDEFTSALNSGNPDDLKALYKRIGEEADKTGDKTVIRALKATLSINDIEVFSEQVRLKNDLLRGLLAGKIDLEAIQKNYPNTAGGDLQNTAATWHDNLEKVVEAHAKEQAERAGKDGPDASDYDDARKAYSDSVRIQDPDLFEGIGGSGGSKANGHGLLGEYVPPSKPSEDLPQFKPGLSTFKVASHIGLTDHVIPLPKLKIFPAKAMRSRSYGIVRPVVEYVDKKLLEAGKVGDDIHNKTGLAAKIQELNERVLNTHKSGINDDPADIINKFATDNHDALVAFKRDMHELRDHVEEKYKTNKDLKGTDQTRWHDDLTTAQKKELLKYIDHMEELAEDLAQGANGENGQAMLENMQKIADGKLDFESVQHSVTGLSKANHVAVDAEIRATGQKPGERGPASYQYQEALVRQINERVYNRHQHTSEPLTYNWLSRFDEDGTDNLEATWQNSIVEVYGKKNPDGTHSVDFDNDRTAENFLSSFMPFLVRGQGAEAVFSMEMLAKLRQAPGKADVKNMPSVGVFDNAVARAKADHPGNPFYNGPEFDLFVGGMRRVLARETGSRIGAEDKTWWLPKKLNPHRFFGLNRQNQYRAELGTYPMEYAMRHKGAGKWALPFNIDIQERIHFSKGKIWNHLSGGVDYKPGSKYRFSSEIKDYDNPEITLLDEGETSQWNRARRSASRILSVGLVNDIQKPFKSLKNPTFFVPTRSLGRIAYTGAGLYGVGWGLDKALDDDYYLRDVGGGLFKGSTFHVPLTYGLAWDLATDGDEKAAPKQQADSDVSSEAPVTNGSGKQTVVVKKKPAATVVVPPPVTTPTDAKKLSTQYVTNTEDNIKHIRTNFDGYKQQVAKIQADKLQEIDERIANHVKLGQTEPIEDLKLIRTKLNTQTKVLLELLEEDKNKLLEEAYRARTEVKNRDELIQASTKLGAITPLIDQQKDYINNANALTSSVETIRAAEINKINALYTSALSKNDTKILDDVPALTTYEAAIEKQRKAAADEDSAALTPVQKQFYKELNAAKENGNKIHTEAKKYVSAISGFVSGPLADNKLSADEMLKNMATWEKDIKALREELAKDPSKASKVDRLDTLLSNTVAQRESIAEKLTTLKENEEAAKKLEQESSDINKQIQGVSEFKDLDKAAKTLPVALNAKKDQIATLRDQSAEIWTQMASIHAGGLNDVNANKDLKYSLSRDKSTDDAVKALSGGEHGIAYQMFGTGGKDGVGSVAGGYATAAWNKIQDWGDSWAESKRNARTKDERFWYNALETGGGILASMVALNFINDNLLGGKMGRGMKWGIMLLVGAYFLHRSGKVGAEMVGQAGSRNAYVQTNYVSKHTPNAFSNKKTAASSGDTKDADKTGEKTVAIRDRHGKPVNHILYSQKDNTIITGVTTQTHKGGMPQSPDSITVTPDAKDKIKAVVSGQCKYMVPDGVHNGKITIDQIQNKDGTNLQGPVTVDFTCKAANDPSMLDQAAGQ